MYVDIWDSDYYNNRYIYRQHNKEFKRLSIEYIKRVSRMPIRRYEVELGLDYGLEEVDEYYYQTELLGDDDEGEGEEEEEEGDSFITGQE